MMEHDVIYLQHGESPIRLEEVGITWCADKINDGDTKYLLATPEREAAPDLLEALDCFLQDYHNGNNLIDAAYKASVAIIRAAPPADGADATLEKE